MRKGLLLSCVMCIVFAAAASAQPAMLGQGKLSIGVTAGSSSQINLGYNLADLTKLGIGFGFENDTPAQTTEGVDPDSESSWSVAIDIHRYLSGLANSQFAPFIGGGVNFNDTGDTRKTGLGFQGFFGAEGFLSDHMSVSGYIGFQYQQQGKLDIEGQPELDGRTDLGTARSAITANLYW